MAEFQGEDSGNLISPSSYMSLCLSLRGRGCPSSSRSKHLLRLGGYGPHRASVPCGALRVPRDAPQVAGELRLRGLHVPQLCICALNRASWPMSCRNVFGKAPQSALRPAGGPISVLSRGQSGQNPARKPGLRPRNIISELRGLVRREAERPVQSWPRAHVVGCGSQRLSMSVFTHLGRRGGSFALPIQLGRAAFLNRSGSRRAASPPSPSPGCVIPLSSQPRSSTLEPAFSWGWTEAAAAALSPTANGPITFVVDCRHNQQLGRHGFRGESIVPTLAGMQPSPCRFDRAPPSWSGPIPEGLWLLHPHGLGRSPHPRVRQLLEVGPQWVATGPGRNYIKVAATRLSKEINLKLAEQEYEELVQVLLGNSRQTMTPVAGEFQARCVFHGGEPG